MPPKPGRSGSSTSSGRSGPLLLLAIALLAGCDRADETADAGPVRAVSFVNGQLRFEGGSDQERMLARALVAAMARASRAEVELEELKALCSVKVPL